MLSAITGADRNVALGKRGRFSTFLRDFKCGENLCPTNYKLFCESSPFGSKLKLMDAKRVKSSGCAEKRNLPRGKKNSAQRKGGNAGIINLN